MPTEPIAEAATGVLNIIVRDARGLPKRICLEKARDFVISITCDNSTKRTRTATSNAGAVEWNETLTFDASLLSTLEFELHFVRERKRTVVSVHGISAEELRLCCSKDVHMLQLKSKPRLFSVKDVFLTLSMKLIEPDMPQARLADAASAKPQSLKGPTPAFGGGMPVVSPTAYPGGLVDTVPTNHTGPPSAQHTDASPAEPIPLAPDKSLHPSSTDAPQDASESRATGDREPESSQPPQNEAAADLASLQSIKQAAHNITQPGFAQMLVKGDKLVSEGKDFVATEYNIWSPLLDRVKAVVDVVDKVAQIHPYASMAWAVISVIPKTINQQIERDARVVELVKTLDAAFQTLEEARDLQRRCEDHNQAEIIKRIFQQTSACGDFIKSYASESSFWKRLVKNAVGNTDQIVTQYKNALAGLRQHFLDRTTVTTKICVLEITSQVERANAGIDFISEQLSALDATVNLKDLPYGDGARYDPAKVCLEGTRVAFLQRIEDWVQSSSSERMLVLFGQAGTGKSAIASSIAQRFDEQGLLTSSFVFSRNFARAPHLPITTLARDLSDHCPQYKRALVESLRGDASFSLGTRDCPTLFKRLLLDQLDKFDFVTSPLIIIDALDECGNEAQRASLVSTLAENISLLPHNFRFLVTARAERDLEEAFGNAESVRIIRTDDEQTKTETEGDILRYTRSRLRPLLSDDECLHIAQLSGTLFQWTSVACSFILHPPPGKSRSKCIELISSSSSQKQLDELYRNILTSLFPTILEDSDILARFRSVIGLLLVPLEPMSRESLVTFGRFTSSNHEIAEQEIEEDIQSVIEGMGSLLSNVTIAQSMFPIAPLHASFRDFLTSDSRSGPFFINLSVSHTALTQSCLNLLLDSEQGVRFNICQIPLSYGRNLDVPDLSTLIERHIPSTLLYACQFWDEHLEQAPYSEDILSLTKMLFEEKLLFWLEALSLTGSMNLAISALSSLQDWLSQVDKHYSEDLSVLNALVKDAISFIRAFGSIMAHHAAHIYLSALPFCPSSAAIYQTYSRRFTKLLRVTQGQSHDWPALQTTITTSKFVRSAIFSPKGDMAACGLEDCTVRLYDAITGEAVLEPLRGHTGPVYSVAFSPVHKAKTRIASGSKDHTVRVWDASSGKALLEPLKGHTGQINSVAFSPDGTLIISASHDKLIRFWDAVTAEPVGFPLQHKHSVLRAVYSPDSSLIASSSTDGSVYIWDAKSRELIGKPFSQHTNRVRSIAFSPDSRLVVSGSDDTTILVWEATTGKITAGPFKGHTGPVYAVAFSPEGHTIASGSQDNSIRMWSTATGRGTGNPLTGHSSPVTTVSFSPDGNRILSGSYDSTIKIWNAVIEAEDSTIQTPRDRSDTQNSAQSEALGEAIVFSPSSKVIAFRSGNNIQLLDINTNGALSGSLVGHSSSVQCAAFTSDGNRLATGSRDRTIRVWDITRSQDLFGPLEGHSDWVRAIAISPNDALIASGSADHTIRVWDASTGALIIGPLEGHSHWIYTIAFSPDSRHIVSGSRDSTVRVWDANTGKAVLGPLQGHTSDVLSVAFSPDGKYIASGHWDETIHIWNVKTGQLAAEPCTGQEGSVISLAFSPGSSRIVSGSFNGTVCVWDAATSELIAGPFGGHASRVMFVAFSPSGEHIVSVSLNGVVRTTSLVASERLSHAEILDTSICDGNGWVKGQNGELMFWIPEPHRAGFMFPNTIDVKGAALTHLDYSSFVHGDRWAECYTRETRHHAGAMVQI